MRYCFFNNILLFALITVEQSQHTIRQQYKNTRLLNSAILKNTLFKSKIFFSIWDVLTTLQVFINYILKQLI